ncbi:MAG: hypothetical protein IJ654_07890 [Bacteroidales bacterium]|nr:hypothetical protein [Bacteroidales bacterium]
MNETLKKVLTWVVLPVIIALLVYAVVASIMKPVNFNKERDIRKAVAIQQLKDIRTLEVAYKGVTGHFTADLDSLKDFYLKGQMPIVMQVGSADDSLAWAHTEAVKKAFKGKGKMTGMDLLKLYEAGDRNLVFSVENKIPVKDTLFASRQDFDINQIKYIPFSEGDEVIMDAVVKMVSGVQVPLFEAKMPYKSLLHGMDNQLRINLDAEQRDMNRYEGLQVGSITAPNNNAGNWE